MNERRFPLTIGLLALLILSLQMPARAQADDLDLSTSELRPVIERFSTDRGSLSRFYTIQISPVRQARMKQFYSEWLDRLAKLDFNRLSHAGQIDYLLFKNHLDHELRQLDIQAKQIAETEPLTPFAKAIIELHEARRRMEPVKPQQTAALLNELNKQIAGTRKNIEAAIKADPNRFKKTVANRAAMQLAGLRTTLKSWFDYYNGYDPLFSWWVSEPYKQLDQSLQNYVVFLREKVVGVKADDKEAIIGDPIGREALVSELQYEMIPYTPEELIAIARQEFAWCEAEMLRASRELGYGDDWKKALEHVKNLYVEPGKQPDLVRQLALEAIDYLDKHDLVTVPQLARDTWRMEMLSPEQQLVSPFFLGGEFIQISYPTSTMPHDAKLMSMRGNNPHFSRATVHHELFPGHGLQQFMTARYKTYRAVFGTPFWTEGWSLYWEFLLWDMKFPRSPEDRIGMLFWRMHRCARIMFSLGFHLEQMTPQQCIDLLVDRVGHEVDNATAEVRRSFAGNYGPLYQCAYMLGGLQFYALHRELVDSGKMTNRAFHDAILKENRIPVEMVRAILTRQKLTRDYTANWKFYNFK
ncbi:MAG TPA: DUF885 family protein [Blastocatellia bacterium]|nr:DUF885 family protein [Blastocatellia bacterium]